MISSLSSSSSSSSATVRVEKATSDLLIGPDWTMNIGICDSINSNHWEAKDVVKAVKKRLQHKNPKVQLLALTLLETMVKNCGDYVHLQIAEKNILHEMIKIVKKKADLHVRDKILVLLDSWQEAFGGPGGKYPQYYWAYEELKRFGVAFPHRSPDSAPIFTPPVTHSTLRHAQAGYGMPSNSSTRLDEAMANEMENLSLSSINSMKNVLDLLADMLQAVNPNDRASVKNEVIVDLVNQCRSNQKKLMQMLTTTGDEELLSQGLELNDSLQSVLAKHDSIASGSPLMTRVSSFNPPSVNVPDSSLKPTELKDSSQTQSAETSETVVAAVKGQVEEEEDEEDDFAQLARRHSRTQSTAPGTPAGTNGNLSSTTASNDAVSSVTASSALVPSNALGLPDPPASVRTTKDQDMIDLLSITLSTNMASPRTSHTPETSTQNINQAPVSSTVQGYPYSSQAYSGNQSSSYVVPWAQPQPYAQPHLQPQPPSQLHTQPHQQPQFQSQLQTQPHQQPQIRSQAYSQPHQHSQPQSQAYSRPHREPQPQAQPYSQPHQQPQPQSQAYSQSHQPPQPQSQAYNQSHQKPLPQSQAYTQPHQQPPLPQSHSYTQPHQQEPRTHLQYSSGYPPPPWAPTPGYFNNQNSRPQMFTNPPANPTESYNSMQAARPLQHFNSFPARGSNELPTNGIPSVNPGPRTSTPAGGQKPFIPSYRLFEDLNVLGNSDGRFKMTGSSSPSLSGTSGQSMVGGRK